MIDSINTPKPTTRTLAVIDGGLNVKARVHRVQSPFDRLTITPPPGRVY